MNHRFLESQNQRLKWMFLFVLVFCAFSSLFSETSWAVTVVQLQEPIRQLKSDIFGGWMMAVKIAAAASGIIISAFRASLIPFGIGAGLSVGIHFFDRWLGAGADGALI